MSGIVTPVSKGESVKLESNVRDRLLKRILFSSTEDSSTMRRGMNSISALSDPNMRRRKLIDRLFVLVAKGFTGIAVGILGYLLFDVIRQGMPHLDLDFFNSFPSRFAHKSGILASLTGSLWLLCLTALIAVPIGIAAAVYIEELMPKSRVKSVIEVNLANLAGVPSIVYGILGLMAFVQFFGFNRSILAGAATLSLLAMPIIIISSREALRSVPQAVRQAAFGLGAQPLQVVIHHVMPGALPGICTGIILSMSRIVGETAPLIVIGAASYTAFVPTNVMDEFSALPLQIYNWAARPQVDFHSLSAAAIVVLLTVLLSFNAIAIVLRNKYQRKY